MKIGDRVRYLSDPFVQYDEDVIYEGKTGIVDNFWDDLVFVLFDDQKLNLFEGQICSTGFFEHQFEVIG